VNNERQTPISAGPDSGDVIRWMNLLTAYIPLHLAHTMIRLDLVDRLASRVWQPEELANAAGIPVDDMQRLLRGLQLFDLVRIGARGIRLSPSGRLLLADEPSSIRNLLCLAATEFSPAFARLPDALRQGITGYEAAFGHTLFAPGSGIRGSGDFQAFMSHIAEDLADILLQVYDFGEHKRILDIGGGMGTLMQRILGHYPHLAGGLLDLPDVVAEARTHCTALVDSGRLAIFPGNFFDHIPPGFDAYILSQVLHDWNDADCLHILRQCHASMHAGARLLILTCLLRDDGPSDEFAIISDLNMLVLTGGRERTAAEHADLLEQAGFQLEEVIPARMSYAVLVAVPQAANPA